MESGGHLHRAGAALAVASCALALGGTCAVASADSLHARGVARRGHESSNAGGVVGTLPPRPAGDQPRDTRIGGRDGQGGRRSSRARVSGRLRGHVSVFLESCVSGEAQSESYATFAGQISALKGSVQMAIRIDIEERVHGESSFHRVQASGLGVWRLSEPGVKIFRDVKQVTNLASPAAYRALVRFHWLDAEGHVLWRARKHTAVCRQGMPGEPSQGMPGEPSFAGEAPAARML